MADRADGSVDDLERARRVNAERALAPSSFLSLIERRPDEKYAASFDYRGKRISIEFRRMTHQQANALARLPFAYKFVLNGSLPKEEWIQLTDEELERYRVFQLETVKRSLVDAERWREFLDNPENEPLVSPIYEAVAAASGISKEFDQKLDDFLTLSDFGYVYGLVWFSMLHKTPSEIALLPETDVKVVNRWMVKWTERLKERK